ncbi:MAG: hypothetical protein KC994_24095, partial [Candidatus Omnitrophica bacterium]|nr:hypothetical protein [Candidatus Omnitrophota bacterium]
MPKKGPLVFLVVGLSAVPAYADGIIMEWVIAAGAIVAVPITLFIVLVEGCVATWVLRIPFLKAAVVTFSANLVSTLSGIPLMLFERWIFYGVVPKDLHLYFKYYFIASILTYLFFLIVTIFFEWIVWRGWLNSANQSYLTKKLWKSLVLGNVLTYAVLCPLHYLFTSPAANVDELTSDTTWAREPTTSVLYIDSETQFLNRIQTNGVERETMVPFSMKEYFLSEDLETCVYRGTDGNLYHYNASLGKQSLLTEEISEAFNQSATAENKKLAAFVELEGPTPTLEVVPV